MVCHSVAQARIVGVCPDTSRPEDSFLGGTHSERGSDLPKASLFGTVGTFGRLPAGTYRRRAGRGSVSAFGPSGSAWLSCLQGWVKRISQGGMTECPKNEEPFGLNPLLCLQSKLPRTEYIPMPERHPLQDDNFFDLHGTGLFPV